MSDALGTVLVVERSDDEGTPVVNIKCDAGSGNVAPFSAEHVNAAGEDSLPLPGDVAALVDGSGTGDLQAIGYHDPKNEGKALPGEKRFVGRDADGKVVCELWLKGTSAIRFENEKGYVELKEDGRVEFNGVIVDPEGNVEAPQEITAMAAAALVTLSKHVHSTAMGPSGPPTPGQ